MGANGNFIGAVFSAGQLSLIVILAVIVAAAVALNILFAYIWRIKAERKMHNDSLQDRRNALLARLEYLKSGGETEPHTWMDFALFGENGDEDEEDADEEEAVPTEPVNVPVVDDKQPPNTVLMTVDGMSPRMRAKLNMRAKRFDGKKFFVRYSLGFDAKLRLSDDETKARYAAILNDLRSYEGIVLKKNFSNQQIWLDKELLASVMFVGKRLCVALALNPEEFADTKYHGDDRSDKKRFAKTPLVVRILSDNKVEVALYLFAQAAERHQVGKGRVKSYKYDMSELSREQLVCMGSMRVVIVSEISPLSPLFRLEEQTEQAAAADAQEQAASGGQEAAATQTTAEADDDTKKE